MTKAKPKPPRALATQLVVVDSCGECHWWHCPGAQGVGICKRFPPVPLLAGGNVQPITRAEDWCGEFADARADAERPVGFCAPKAAA